MLVLVGNFPRPLAGRGEMRSTAAPQAVNRGKR
jgi:hypothetical protein